MNGILVRFLTSQFFLKYKLYFIIALMTFVASAGGGAYLYYTETNKKLTDQQTKIGELTVASAEKDKIIQKTADDLKLLTTTRKELETQLSVSRASVESLRAKLKKLSDLPPEAAVNHAPLLEKAVNNGTADSLRCFEILSGKPLTEEEKNARKPSQFNTICPDVANPLYKPSAATGLRINRN